MLQRSNLIVVSAHYRVGPYKFIASKEIQSSTTATNKNSPRDQRNSLAVDSEAHWQGMPTRYPVQIFAESQQFGGDAGNVFIDGAGARGASASLQRTEYGGRNDALFHAAVSQSASFGPVLDVPESQYPIQLPRRPNGAIPMRLTPSPVFEANLQPISRSRTSKAPPTRGP